jgi:hypothetical protein
VSATVLQRLVSVGLASLVVTLLCVFVPFSRAQSSGAPDKQAPNLDYEFFKTRVEPIFLKKRSADHARCYVCHQDAHHNGGPLSVEMLMPGKNFWTEEQSRHNFEIVSRLVVPGDPDASFLLHMPLAPEAGGLADTHQGGRQFASQDDPDWQIIKAWVLGQKAQSSSRR